LWAVLSRVIDVCLLLVNVIVILFFFLAVFAKAHHIEVLVQAKVMLEAVGHEQVVEILNDLLDLVQPVAQGRLVVAVHVVRVGQFSRAEDVEERFGLEDLIHCSDLAGLLVLLLLLDFFLCRVNLLPGNFCAFDFLDLVLRFIDELAGQHGGLEELLIFLEVHYEGERCSLLLVFALHYFDMLQGVKYRLILLLDIVPEQLVRFNCAQPEIRNTINILQIRGVDRLLFVVVFFSGDNSGNFLAQIVVDYFKLFNIVVELGELTVNHFAPLNVEGALFLNNLLLDVLELHVELIVQSRAPIRQHM
jgi:hypothetical protein